jgi:hypothetical protein
MSNTACAAIATAFIGGIFLLGGLIGTQAGALVSGFLGKALGL